MLDTWDESTIYHFLNHVSKSNLSSENLFQQNITSSETTHSKHLQNICTSIASFYPIIFSSRSTILSRCSVSLKVRWRTNYQTEVFDTIYLVALDLKLNVGTGWLAHFHLIPEPLHCVHSAQLAWLWHSVGKI